MTLLFLSSCQFSKKRTVKYFNQAKNKTYDAIVVPGVPYEDGEWSKVMKARVYWAKHLMDIGIAKNVIFSGGAVYTPYYESHIMRLYAIELGIPADKIYTDTFAEHSTENIYYSHKLAMKLGFSSVALATDPFQAKQLRRFVEKRISKEVGIIPIVWDTLFQLTEREKVLKIDPSSAFRKGHVPINERESLWQRQKGTRGKQLDESVYK